MSDMLVLNVNVAGENIMSQPILEAHGFAKISGRVQEIKIETPITSIRDFIEAFDGLFKERKS